MSAALDDLRTRILTNTLTGPQQSALAEALAAISPEFPEPDEISNSISDSVLARVWIASLYTIQANGGSPVPPPPPALFATTTTTFVVPPPNGTTPSAPLGLTNVGFLVVGSNIQISNAGYYVVDTVNTGTSQVTLLNFGSNGNVLAGSDIAAGQVVVPGGPSLPMPILGSFETNPNNTGQELSGVFILVPAGTSVVLATLVGGPLALNELVTWGADVVITPFAGGKGGRITRSGNFINSGGVVQNFVGNTTNPTDTDVTANPLTAINPALAGAKVEIDIVPTDQLQVIGTAPPSLDVWMVIGTNSQRRHLLPGTGARSDVLSVTHLSGPGDNVSGPGDGGAVLRLQCTDSNGITQVQVDALVATVVDVPDVTHVDIETPQFFGIAPSHGVFAIFNANGAGNDFSAGYTYTSSLADIFIILGGNGADAHSYIMSNVVHSGGTVTGWTDENTTTPLPATVLGAPTFNASSPSWTPAQASVSTNGLTDGFEIPATDIQAGDGIFLWIVVRWAPQAVPSAAGIGYGINTGACVSVANTDNDTTHVDLTLNGNRGFSFSTGGGVAGQSILIWVMVQDASIGPTGTSTLTKDGTVINTQTGTSSPPNPAGAPFRVAFDNTASPADFAQLEFVTWGFQRRPGSVPPTTAQLGAIHGFSQTKFGTA